MLTPSQSPGVEWHQSVFMRYHTLYVKYVTVDERFWTSFFFTKVKYQKKYFFCWYFIPALHISTIKAPPLPTLLQQLPINQARRSSPPPPQVMISTLLHNPSTPHDETLTPKARLSQHRNHTLTHTHTHHNTGVNGHRLSSFMCF